MSILSACEPRQDIITGSFNPEIFTASLSEVMLHYREGRQGLIRNLLDVWAAEMGNESLRREAQAMLFGLK